MSVIDRAFARIGYVKAQKLPRHLRMVARNAEHEITDRSLYKNQAEAYQQSSWVYIAVSRIAEAAALVDFHVMERGSEEELEEITDHPFELLLRHPNDKLSQFELFETTAGYLELTGNAYWYLTLVNGQPAEIWPLRPDRVEIVPSSTQWIRGYIYEVDNEKIPLRREEVVHFKRWHPLQDYVGLSAIEASAIAIEGDIKAQHWNVNFFKNQAIPGGIVGLGEHISDPEYELIIKQWEGKYSGIDRAHKMAFVRGGDVSVTQLGIPQKDMEFLEGRRFSREEIFQIFGIPMGKWSENATEANAKVAEQTFRNDVLWPKLVRMAQKITAEVLPRYGEGLQGQFEDVRWVSDEQQLMEADLVAKYALMTVDEIRARYWQLEPMEEDEEPEPDSPEEEEIAEFLNLEPVAEGPAQVEEEIRRWRDVSLRLLRQGKKPAERDFKSQVLPEWLKANIVHTLSHAETAEEVKAAFAAPFQHSWAGYP